MSERDWRARLAALDTGIVSDALDRLQLRGATIGIRPMWPCGKIVGRATTLKTMPAGRLVARHHLGVRAITEAEPGGVIVIDSGGRTDVSSWGDLLSTAAQLRGLSGVVIDGACRDVDGSQAVGFPVYARAVVPCTARGRIVEASTNEPVQCGGVHVFPGDLVIADGSGVVFIPQDRAEEVLATAEELFAREQAMFEQLRRGVPIAEVDRQANYEGMLRGEH
ncbi:MAG: RraA family protein [Chloroflexi bacterium]|nr:RraA family protein [Chloroflexota bacterium]